MAKKVPKPEAETPDGVDMERIRALMGPLPNEENVPTADKPEQPTLKELPKTAPPVSKSNKAVSEAAEEANASLKATMQGLGKTTITPVDDDAATEVLADSANEAMPNTEPEDGAAEVVGEGVVADDPKVVDAVDDIVAHEGDAVLEAEDDERAQEANPDPKPKHRFRAWLGALWAKPAFRWILAIIIVLLLLAAAVIPKSRYFVLNTAGVRSSVGVKVVDSSTLQPLKNVTVSIGTISAETDNTGTAKLDHVRLGDTTLQISKRAFTTVAQKLVVGWGSNPEGQFRLVASGVQYSFIVTDFLSGKPIAKAEATSGEGNAISDKNGKIVLSLDTSGKDDSAELDIQIQAADYRDETVKITASDKETSSVKMVPSRKDVYISNRSGKYDIYTIDVDGKNDKKIVSGTGIERPDMDLSVQQNGDLAAFVATRENARNTDGYLLSTLYLVDTKSGTLTKIDQSEQIQLAGWSSDGHLAYVKIAAGASGANPKRFRLMTVNTKNISEIKEIASANAFNDVVMAGDKLLYAPSNALQDNPNPGLFVVDADGSNPVTITNKEVLNIFRTDYSTVTINAAGTFYTYKIGSASSTLTATVTPTNVNRLYIDGFTNGKSLWTDNRDGKGLLLAYDKASGKDTTLATQLGLKLPIVWLNDSDAIFRVNDGKQSADYVVSVNGGEAKRIQDVNDTAGIGRWYYY